MTIRSAKPQVGILVECHTCGVLEYTRLDPIEYSIDWEWTSGPRLRLEALVDEVPRALFRPHQCPEES